MSVQRRLPGFEGSGSEIRPPAEAVRASIGREMLYLLSRSREAGRGSGLTPAGLVHSLGVCLIEDFNMTRGKGSGKSGQGGTAMPTFVDVKLSEADRENFLATLGDDLDAVRCLQTFADTGYRVGVSWSGEHQSYTVSVTCRDEESPNKGLCMTSFAGKLERAILLAWYKHDVICRGQWAKYVPPREESFG